MHILKNKNSLLARIYGVFTFYADGIAPINLILMENSFQSVLERGAIERVYDLKGSLYNRKTDESASVKKDINLMESRDLFLRMSKGYVKSFEEQLKNDTQLLRKSNLMDYSLLLGVQEDKEVRQQPRFTWRRVYGADHTFYSFAIIDYLQEFDLSKRIEYYYKSVKADSKQISSIMPAPYKKRFDNFCNQIVCALEYHP